MILYWLAKSYFLIAPRCNINWANCCVIVNLIAIFHLTYWKCNCFISVLIHEPAVLIEGVLFRARYLGSTQLVCEGQPTKATRMMQAEEAVSRIKVNRHIYKVIVVSFQSYFKADEIKTTHNVLTFEYFSFQIQLNLSKGTTFRFNKKGSLWEVVS